MISTFNKYGVTSHQGEIVILAIGASFTPEDALALAAWLAVMAGLEHRDPEGRDMRGVLADLLARIEDT